MVDETEPARADRRSPADAFRWLPQLLFALFVVGYFAGSSYVRHRPAAKQMLDDGLFQLWIIVIGLAAGLAISSGCYFLFVIAGIHQLAGGPARRSYLAAIGWVGLALGTVLATLFTGASELPDTIDLTLARETRPVTIVLGLCLAPGLVALLLIRAVTVNGNAQARMRLIMRLGHELRRILVLLGAFLTLLVITAGLRRQALLARFPRLDLPSQSVLLYGLTFAVLLGLFFMAASAGVDAQAQAFVDELTPLPDPEQPDFSDALGRRRELAEVVGLGGSWRTFQSVVIVAAPLLTALIGSATG